MNYLDKYFPKTNIFSSLEEELGKYEGEERAFKTWETLLVVKRANESSFLLIGKLLKDVRDEKLYLKLDYENFGQFLESEELSFSREKAYMCIKVYEYFIGYLEFDPDRIGQLNISRLSMMVPFLKQIEDKTEAAKQVDELSKLRHGDFVREVKARTNRDGKPAVFWSEELSKWIIQYHRNITHLQDLGEFGTTE